MRAHGLRACLTALLCAAAVLGEEIRVRGSAEDVEGNPVAGVKFEFLLAGSPERKPAVTGPDGKYSLSLVTGPYEIFAYLPGQAKPFSGRAWLDGRAEVVVNARVPKGSTDKHSEYDMLAEWRVTGEGGRGVGPARVFMETLLYDGKRATFPVYIPAAEDEKEIRGAVETAPDGRFVFRIRESHLIPENVLGLTLRAEMPGYEPGILQIFPSLQFSETGHLYPAYPEDGISIPLKKPAVR